MTKPPQCPNCGNALVEDRNSEAGIWKCAFKKCSKTKIILGTDEISIPALFDSNMAKAEIKKAIEARVEELEEKPHGGDLDDVIESLKDMKEMISIKKPDNELRPEGHKR